MDTANLAECAALSGWQEHGPLLGPAAPGEVVTQIDVNFTLE
jgi:hypothetical protein